MKKKLSQFVFSAFLGAAVGVAVFFGVEIYKTTEEDEMGKAESKDESDD